MWKKHRENSFISTQGETQYSLFPCAQKKYGKEAQMIEDGPESPPFNKVEQKFIQKVTGKFLYLGRAIDSTLLTPLSAIASQQAAPTHHSAQCNTQNSY